MDYYNFEFGNTLPHSTNNFLPGIFVALGIALILLLFFFFVMFIVCYVFKSISLYTMAKNRGISNPWLAWVPRVNNYIIAQLINDQVSIGSLHIPNASIFLVIVPLASGLIISLLSYIPIIGLLMLFPVTIILSIYVYAAIYWLFKIYDPKNAVLFFVLSIFIPFASAFFIFSLRNKKPNFSNVPVTRPCPTNEKSILALALGIMSIVVNITATGLWIGAAAIIFGILSYQETRDSESGTTLSIIGIVCGGIGILLSIILPFTSIALLNGFNIMNILTDSVYTNTIHYPFI